MRAPTESVQGVLDLLDLISSRGSLRDVYQSQPEVDLRHVISNLTPEALEKLKKAGGMPQVPQRPLSWIEKIMGHASMAPGALVSQADVGAGEDMPKSITSATGY